MNAPVNSPARILVASLVGTTIEFFDFYIFATAAVLVFPHLFFPASDPTSAVLQSFATFSIAFFARPLGAALFGHFGDRIGRKATLVAALMTMGLSTVLIGFLPGYERIGVVAPLLLALCRFGQGLGLGGEWGGAVLLAAENAPPGRRSWYAMFPQLGAPLGFVLSAGSFLVLTETLSNAEFLAWGWRVPFMASILLVLLGLYVRLRITETPEFQKVVEARERVARELPRQQVARGRAERLGDLEVAAADLLEEHVAVAAVEGRQARQHLVEQRAEAPPVDSAPVARAVQHLRREVLGRAAERVRAAVDGVDVLLREPEVGQAHVALVVQQHVFGLEVAVDDVHLVQVLEREHDLRDVEAAARLVELALAAQVEEELAARAVVEHEVELVGRLERVVEPDDERVHDAAEHVALRLGVLDLVALDDVGLLQHLHRVDAARVALAHLHDLAEGALADDL